MQQKGGKSKRIESTGLTRGIVMVITAPNHSRDFFHCGAFTDDPLNLSTTTPIFYFTRYALWIAVVVALYPLCRWHDKHKTTHPGKNG